MAAHAQMTLNPVRILYPSIWKKRNEFKFSTEIRESFRARAAVFRFTLSESFSRKIQPPLFQSLFPYCLSQLK